MKCPVCDETLREIQKHNVTVDICPGCKGIWLDRGELEKILEMASVDGQTTESRGEYARPEHIADDPRMQSREKNEDDYHNKRDYDEHSRGKAYPHKKKRGSWLGEIFDGFGGD